jgi:replicative DNA helicase
VDDTEQQREEALLGSLLIQRNRTDLFYAIAHQLKPEHFYKNTNGMVYKAISDLTRNRHPVDLVTVNEAMKKCKSPMWPDDLATLSERAMGLTPDGAKHYADAIVEQYQVREARRLASNVSRVESAEDISSVNTELGQILLSNSTSRFSVLAEDCEDVIQHILDVSNGVKSPGIKLGYHELDTRIVGLAGGNQMVIGASTSVGKTTLAWNIAWNVTEKHKVGFFSGEQSKNELYLKAFSFVLGIPASRLRAGKLTESEKEKMKNLPWALQERGLVTDFAPLEINNLILQMRRMVMEHGIKLAVIDYMQIVECAEGDSREQKVSTVSRLTKRAAMELDIPVIILAQINREWAKRKEHKPELFDLRESGAIEQNTDYALMVYRQLDEGVLHCNLAKNRIDGRTGEFDLLFRPDSGMYVDTYGTQTNSR